MLWAGMALYRPDIDADALGRAVPALMLRPRRPAVELDEPRVVDVGPEGALDGLQIRRLPVRGELPGAPAGAAGRS